MRVLIIALLLAVCSSALADQEITVLGELKTNKAFGGVIYRTIETINDETVFLTIESAMHYQDCEEGTYKIVASSPLPNNTTYELNSVECDK